MQGNVATDWKWKDSIQFNGDLLIREIIRNGSKYSHVGRSKREDKEITNEEENGKLGSEKVEENLILFSKFLIQS